MRVRVVPFPAAVSAPPPDGAKAPRSRPQSSVGAALRRPALSSADLRRGSNPVPMRMNPEIHADTRNERVWNPGHGAQSVLRTSPRAPCVSATSIDTGTQLLQAALPSVAQMNSASRVRLVPRGKHGCSHR